MRKVKLGIDVVKANVAALKGCPIKLLINKGRKKIVKVLGEITQIYPSVFTVKVEGSKTCEMLSYSYSDVLCGDVQIFALNEPSQASGTSI